MTLKYPDEVDFTDLPVEFTGVETIDDVIELLHELESEVENEPGDEYDLFLNKMGIKGNAEITFLWDGNPCTVQDARNFGHHLVLRDHRYSEQHQYAEYQVEDLDTFIFEWFEGNIVPAVRSDEWVPRRGQNNE